MEREKFLIKSRNGHHKRLKKTKSQKDYLWLHLRELPYFRSLLRAVEARFYEEFTLDKPVLDVGCGDGHFASVVFDEPLDAGIDPWEAPIHEASRRGAYRLLAQSEGGEMPFPAASFNTAISNSVLEHIPDVEAVLRETARVLKPGGTFLFCVPNHNFLGSLSIGRLLDRLGLRRLGDAYRRFFNRIARHHHSDPPEVWQARLEAAGFQVERWWHYYSPRAMQVSEWGHLLGLPSLVARKLTGRWILAPTRWNLGLTYRLLKPYYDEDPRREDGVCTFYVARRSESVVPRRSAE
jgi:SAM-dependent methyltransferase